MGRRLPIVLVWLTLWIVVGLAIAMTTQDEAAIALPLFGALYGAIAGTVHAVLVSWIDSTERAVRVRASMLGVVASLVSVPILWLIGGMTPAYAIAFAVGAGALTGLVIPPSLLTEGADRIDPRRSTGR